MDLSGYPTGNGYASSSSSDMNSDVHSVTGSLHSPASGHYPPQQNPYQISTTATATVTDPYHAHNYDLLYNHKISLLETENTKLYQFNRQLSEELQKMTHQYSTLSHQYSLTVNANGGGGGAQGDQARNSADGTMETKVDAILTNLTKLVLLCSGARNQMHSLVNDVSTRMDKNYEQLSGRLANLEDTISREFMLNGYNNESRDSSMHSIPEPDTVLHVYSPQDFNNGRDGGEDEIMARGDNPPTQIYGLPDPLSTYSPSGVASNGLNEDYDDNAPMNLVSPGVMKDTDTGATPTVFTFDAGTQSKEVQNRDGVNFAKNYDQQVATPSKGPIIMSVNGHTDKPEETSTGSLKRKNASPESSDKQTKFLVLSNAIARLEQGTHSEESNCGLTDLIGQFAPPPHTSQRTSRKVKKERVAHAIDDDLPNEYRCICGFQSTSKENLRQHVKRLGTVEPRFKCTQAGCDKAFIFPFHVKKHLVNDHKLQNVPVGLSGCQKCYKMFPDRDQLATHRNARNEICKDSPRRQSARLQAPTGSLPTVTAAPVHTSSEAQMPMKPSIIVSMDKSSTLMN